MDRFRLMPPKQRLCEQENQTASQIPNESTLPDNDPEILKLPQECFDKIFEWLSLKCLDNFGQTCKHIHSFVGDYFQRNFVTIQCEIKENGMLLNCPRRCYECNSFNELIENVLFRQNEWENDVEKFHYAAKNCKSIRKIECEYSKLGEAALECLRPILHNLESMQINRCTITDKFRCGFPAACPNLKQLSIENGNWQMEHVWLNHGYPNLMHLDWKDTLKFNELIRFFELNPNVRSFRTNLSTFWANRYQFLMADIKLCDLTIDLNCKITTVVIDLLNEFYNFGIYNRLHVFVGSIEQKTIDALKSLVALDTLGLHFIDQNIDLTQLTQLKELSNDLYIGRRVSNMTDVAISLINLERVNLNSATTNEFFPFLQHSPMLKMMRIYNVMDKNDFDCILDLSAINEEREKLATACKVTIYIDDGVYLATKWVTNKTDCNLIEIKRADSYDWNDRLLNEYECEHEITNQSEKLQKIKINSPLFKLNVDCFDEIFDYLSFKELDCLAQTCKPLNLVAGDYFQRNFFNLQLDDRKCQRMKLLNFDKSIQKIRFYSGKLKSFRNVAFVCNKSINQIYFDGIPLVANQIEFIEEILSKIHIVKIKNCRVSRKFYETFPNMCPELRRLVVENIRIRARAIRRIGNQWLLQSYPKLEHLGWIQVENDCKIAEINTFFVRNPNVRSFSTNYSCLWASRKLIMESAVKLIELIVEIDAEFCHNIDQLYDLLRQLYEKGIFKRLSLRLIHHEPHHIERMTSLHALTGLKLVKFSRDIHLSPLSNLRELTLDESFYYENGKLIGITNADIVASALANIERVHFKKTILGDILSFAHHSINLKKMKIDYVFFKKDFKYILNLPKMNNEREKLFEARKLTIYIEDKVYLATKWKHYNTDLKSIEMKRIESSE